MEDFLKPCPFCGGKPYVNVIEPHTHYIVPGIPDYSGGAFVECSECSCGISGDNREDAIKNWNRRAEVK